MLFISEVGRERGPWREGEVRVRVGVGVWGCDEWHGSGRSIASG